MNKRDARKLALSIAISVIKATSDTGGATEMMLADDIEEKDHKKVYQELDTIVDQLSNTLSRLDK